MKLSEKGLLEIAGHEGIVPAPYRDSAGHWTFGIGHTAGAGDPDPAALPRGMPDDLDGAIDDAIDLFRRDIASYEARVNDAIDVPLAQHQFDALVSFDFNTGGIHRARLSRAINAGDPDASRHFLGWLKPPEIRARRMAEKLLFETGDYEANGDSIVIWRVDRSGRLGGVEKTISGAEMLERMMFERILRRTNSEIGAPGASPARHSEGRKTTMSGFKGFFASKSIWGGLIALIGGGISFAGYSLSADDAASISQLVQGIVASVGGLLAIFGRVKASRPASAATPRA